MKCGPTNDPKDSPVLALEPTATDSQSNLKVSHVMIVYCMDPDTLTRIVCVCVYSRICAMRIVESVHEAHLVP